MAAKPSTTKPPSKVYDVLIVGAGPAGLTVASTIVRQLQTAIVFDTGVYRYGRTNHLYGVPGFDHVEPDTYRLKTRGDILRRYDSVTFKNAYIEEVKRLDNGNFQATDGWLNVYEGRKVVLAAGVKDITPMMEGYDFCWGRGIFNDILYHGLEERGGDSAGLFVFETSSSSDTISQVGSLALQLSRTVRVYTNGNEEAAYKIQAIAGRPDVQSRITIEERPIRSVYMVSSEASDVLVTLTDGAQFKESYIVHQPPIELNGPDIESLGLEKGPRGEIKVYPPFNETSIHGVFAAGDAASRFHAVSNAIYGGSVASAGLITQLQADQAQLQAEQFKLQAEQIKLKAEQLNLQAKEEKSQSDRPETHAEQPEVQAEVSQVQVELQAV